MAAPRRRGLGFDGARRPSSAGVAGLGDKKFQNNKSATNSSLGSRNSVMFGQGVTSSASMVTKAGGNAARSHLRRKASSGYLDSSPSMNSRLGNITFTDLFLSDTKLIDSRTHSAKSLLPLPPGLLAEMTAQAEHDKELHKHVNTDDKSRRRHETQQQVILQDYFKTFATWPRTSLELEQKRERLQEFTTAFHVQDGLLRHCGERLKCNAFVVVSHQKISLRSEPTTSENHIIPGEVLYPGQMVIADSIVIRDTVKFLKIRDGTWTFDRKGFTRCMAYITCVEVGLWWYRVVSVEYAEVRTAPSLGEKLRSGYLLCPGEVCVVALRCMVDDRCWMHLADGRGWIFEMRPKDAVRDGANEDDEMPEVVMIECTDREVDYIEEDATMQSHATEVGLWEYECVERTLAVGATVAGAVLEPGDKVLVDLRAPANGQKQKLHEEMTQPTIENRIWLRLSDGRGWIPKTDLTGMPNLKFVRMAFTGAIAPLRGLRNFKMFRCEDDDDDWTQGVA